jgi:hypothetical protein
MLRISRRALAVSPYSQFLIDTRGKYANMNAADRSRKIASEYKALSASQRERLSSRAALNDYHKGNKPSEKVRKPNAYATFVRSVFPTLSGPPTQRIKTIGQMWRRQKNQKETLQQD